MPPVEQPFVEQPSVEQPFVEQPFVEQPFVEQCRGSIVESVHPFSVALARGERVELAGPDVETTFRSAAKPFQLACALEALGDPAVSDEELAVGAASHSAEPVHVAIVERLLARFGLGADELRCGAHAPMHAPSAEALLRAGQGITQLHNNCSGKHTFMLAASVAQGWPRDYRDPDHPLQRRIAEALFACCGQRGPLATDGCGVPTFGLPLSAIARGWARVAEAMDDDSGLGRVGRAMAAHPELTSGTGRLDLEVVRHAHEPVAVKIGAQGLFCLAFPRRALGVAVKVRSGSGDALPAAVSATLTRFVPGAFTEPEDWTLRRVRNVVGRVVGEWSTRIDG